MPDWWARALSWPWSACSSWDYCLELKSRLLQRAGCCVGAIARGRDKDQAWQSCYIKVSSSGERFPLPDIRNAIESALQNRRSWFCCRRCPSYL